MEFSFLKKKILEGQKKYMIALDTFFYTFFKKIKNKECKNWAQKLVFIIHQKTYGKVNYILLY
jgi:hypothetical protein